MDRSHSPTRTRVVLIFALVILIPSMLGFVAKFIEFVNTFRGEMDGAFAITPMVNYLLATLGFLSLLIWAAINGMFHDIEQPKHTMLDQEHQLDRTDGALECVPTDQGQAVLSTATRKQNV